MADRESTDRALKRFQPVAVPSFDHDLD